LQAAGGGGGNGSTFNSGSGGGSGAFVCIQLNLFMLWYLAEYNGIDISGRGVAYIQTGNRASAVNDGQDTEL
jgi:hypothetical protein